MLALLGWTAFDVDKLLLRIFPAARTQRPEFCKSPTHCSPGHFGTVSPSSSGNCAPANEYGAVGAAGCARLWRSLVGEAGRGGAASTLGVTCRCGSRFPARNRRPGSMLKGQPLRSCRPEPLDHGDRGRSRGPSIVFILNDPVLDVDPGPPAAAGAVACRMSIVENERLQAEVRCPAGPGACIAGMPLGGSSHTERRRVEAKISMDGAQQRLVTLALQLNQARYYAGTRHTPVAALLDDATQDLELAISELRELARGVLIRLCSVGAGLAPAVTTLVECRPTAPRYSATGGRLAMEWPLSPLPISSSPKRSPISRGIGSPGG